MKMALASSRRRVSATPAMVSTNTVTTINAARSQNGFVSDMAAKLAPIRAQRESAV